MKSKEVLKILGVTRTTLTKYVKEGTIKVTKMKNGYYNYDDDSVYAFIGLKKKKHNSKIISYARVSTQNQKEQLKAQSNRIYESCISKGIVLDEQIEDIKSGMSFDRKGFDELCQEVIRGNVEMIVIENKDRLMRFGYEMFEKFFRYFGTKILVLNDEISNKSYEQELTDDLISIIHYFSMKSYSHRRKLNKLRKELEVEKKEHL
jgi:predicted site-specific integrase-resolvase